MCLSVLCLSLPLAFQTLDFFETKATYYYERNNSSATPSQTVRLSLCTGQSASFGTACASFLIETYEATILKKEEAEGVTNYYCFSPRFPKGIRLFGEIVNLQIAESDQRTCVGTPIIFGSF